MEITSSTRRRCEVARPKKASQSAPGPRRSRTIPGLFLILAQLPPDLRAELGTGNLMPEQQHFFALGYLRCAAERAAAPEPGYGPPQPPVVDLVRRQSHAKPVTHVPGPQDRVAMAVGRDGEEVAIEAPLGPAWGAIGHWSAEIVAEVLSYYSVIALPEYQETAIAMGKAYLERHDESCPGLLPGSWREVAERSLDPVEGPCMKRIRKPTPTPFDGSTAGAGAFGDLLHFAPGGPEG